MQKNYKIHFEKIRKSLKYFLGSSIYQISRDTINILASKENSQAWIVLRESTGRPTSVCLFQALLVSRKTEKEKEHEGAQRRLLKIKCIQHGLVETDPISRMVTLRRKNGFRKLSVVLVSSHWYLSYFCVIHKHSLSLTWNMTCDKR